MERFHKLAESYENRNPDDNSVTISYDFSGIAFATGSTDSKRWTVEIDGFSSIQSENGPLIPQKKEFIHIPGNSPASIEIVDSSYVSVTRSLAPAPPELLEDEIYYEPAPVSTDYKFAHKCVEISRSSSYRNEKILCININPIKYIESTKKLEVLTHVTFKITFDTPETNCFPKGISPRDHFFSKRVTSISNKFIDLYNSEEDPRRMLVLTVPKFDQLLDSFVTVKKRFGIDVDVISKTQWTEESIKEEIRSQFKKTMTYIIYCW